MRFIEDMDNIEVLDAVRNKNPQDIVKLYGKFFPVVYRKAYGILQDDEGAKQITQKVYAQFSERIDEVDLPEKLDHWVDGLIRQEADRFRQESLPPDPKSTAIADRLINKILIVMAILIVVLFLLFR